MASAERVQIVAPVEGIALTLTEEEAGALASILSNVGGSADATRRGLADSVAWALRAERVVSDSRDIRSGAALQFLTPDEVADGEGWSFL